MIVPDTNLLIYAYDNSFPQHAKAKVWWEEIMNGLEPVGLPWVVVLAFVRLAPHPKIAANPRPVEEVRDIVNSWLHAPHVRILPVDAAIIGRFFDVLCAAGQGGNLSTDALIAAHALDAHGRVFTADRDFARFPGIVAVNPLNG
jgi:toxin-antitoxin system PIN domain toxin